MELRNKVTGGIFSCDDELGNRLLSEGYEKVGAAPTPAEEAPAKPAVKRSPRKAAGAH